MVVQGTGRDLNQGNGFTVWDMSWDELLKGSATGAQTPGRGADAPASPSPSPSK